MTAGFLLMIAVLSVVFICAKVEAASPPPLYAYILYPIWALCLPSAFLFILSVAKKLNFGQILWIGIIGRGIISILPLFLAPAFAAGYIVEFIVYRKEIKRNKF